MKIYHQFYHTKSESRPNRLSPLPDPTPPPFPDPGPPVPNPTPQPVPHPPQPVPPVPQVKDIGEAISLTS